MKKWQIWYQLRELVRITWWENNFKICAITQVKHSVVYQKGLGWLDCNPFLIPWSNHEYIKPHSCPLHLEWVPFIQPIILPSCALFFVCVCVRYFKEKFSHPNCMVSKVNDFLELGNHYKWVHTSSFNICPKLKWVYILLGIKSKFLEVFSGLRHLHSLSGRQTIKKEIDTL